MQSHSNEPQQEEEERPKPSRKRRVLVGAAWLLGLLIVGWWVISSEMFLRGVVIKKIGKAIGAEITCESADWSPRRSIVLRGARVKAIGQEPCLEAGEITFNYQLGDLLAGNIELGDITFVEPVISIHMDAEGKSNLDPFFEKREKSGEPEPVRIGRLALQQGTVDFQRQFHSGSEERVKLTHLEIRGENIGNKLAGKLNITAGVQYALHRTGEEVADKLEGTLSLECDQELDLKWFPKSVTARAKVLVNETSGQFDFAGGLQADLESQLTPTELKKFQLKFQHEENPIGNLLVSGPMDLRNGSADLQVAVEAIEEHVLNFAGRPYGLDFHKTMLSSTNRLMIGRYGEQIELQGAISATPVQMSLGLVPFPSVDALETQYDFTVDLTGKQVVIDALSLNATHKGKRFLAGEINRSMTIPWGGEIIKAPDAEFQLEVANTDAADWQPWLGRYAQSGAVAAKVKISVKENGREIRFGSSGSITSLQLPLDGKVIEIGDFHLNAKGQLTNFRKLEFSQFTADAGRPGKNYFKYEGEPVVDLATQIVSGSKSKLEGELAVLLGWFPQKDVSCQSGRATYNGAFTVGLTQSGKQTVAGTMHWENVSGVIKSQKLDRVAGTADLNLTLEGGHQLHIDRFSGATSVAGQSLVAKVSLGGDWNLRTGTLDLKKVNLLELDLIRLKTIMPVRGVESGSADFQLESLKLAPGKNGFVHGTVTLRDGRLSNWPKDVNGILTASTRVVWGEDGSIKLDVPKLDGKLFAEKINGPTIAMIQGRLADVDLTTGAFSATLDSSRWTEGVLQPLLVRQFGSTWLKQARVTHLRPLKITSDGRGGVALKGPLHMTDVIFDDITGHLPKDKLKVETDLDLTVFSRGRQWEVHAKNVQAELFVKDRMAGRVTLIGEFDSEAKTGKYNFTVGKVDHWVVNLLPQKWRGGVKIKSGRIEAITAKGKVANGRLSFDVSTDFRAVAIDDERVGWWPKKPVGITQQLIGTHQLGSGANFDFTTNEGIFTRGDSVIAEYNSPTNLKDGEFLLNLKSLHLGTAFMAQAIQNGFPGYEAIAGSLHVRQSELRLSTKNKAHFRGELEFRDFSPPPLVAEVPGVSVDMVINGSIDLGADENGLWLPILGDLNGTINRGTIKRRKKPAGQISLKVENRGFHKVVAKELDVSVLRLLEPVWPQAWGIIGGRAEADVELNWGVEPGLHCKGSWEMKDWEVRDRDGQRNGAISATGKIDMSWKGENLDLKQCSVNLGGSDLAENHVKYRGKYNFSDPQKVIGNITVESDGVELLPVLRIIDAEPLSEKSRGLGVSVDMTLKAKHLYWNGLEAVDFNAFAQATNKNSDFQKMHAGHLRWKGLEATDVNASAIFTKEISNFRRIRMNLGGGPLNATYKQDRTSKPVWNHDVTIAGRRVELKPLLDLFVEGQHKPWVSAQKWGRLNARVRLQWLQGPGMDWDWRTVRAEGLKGVGSDAILNVSGAAITIPKRDEAKVGILGILLKIPAALDPLFVKENKLNEVKVNSIKLQGRIQEGKVSARVRAGTIYYKAATGGKAIMLAKRLGDTEVSNLPVQITLKPEMAKEFRSRLLDSGMELPLPVFLKIDGKIGDLRVKENTIILTTLIGRALSNKPLNVAVDALEEASGVIDKILPVNPLNILFPRDK